MELSFQATSMKTVMRNFYVSLKRVSEGDLNVKFASLY